MTVSYFIEILTNNGIQAEYHEYKGALRAFIHYYSKVMDDAEDALRRGSSLLCT